MWVKETPSWISGKRWRNKVNHVQNYLMIFSFSFLSPVAVNYYILGDLTFKCSKVTSNAYFRQWAWPKFLYAFLRSFVSILKLRISIQVKVKFRCILSYLFCWLLIMRRIFWQRNCKLVVANANSKNPQFLLSVIFVLCVFDTLETV